MVNDINLLRTFWILLPRNNQRRLKAALYALLPGDDMLNQATGFLLGSGMVFTWTPKKRKKESPLIAEMRAAERQGLEGCRADEFLCAIACWENDEPYVRTEPMWTHPRWVLPVECIECGRDMSDDHEHVGDEPE